MTFIQVLSCFLLLIHTSLSINISFTQPHGPPDKRSSNHLEKRWDFWMRGFPVPVNFPGGPVTTEDMNNYIDLAITLATYIVDNVQKDDAIFIQFFGHPDYHPYVMDVFSRLKGIRTATGLYDARVEVDELHIVAAINPTVVPGENPSDPAVTIAPEKPVQMPNGWGQMGDAYASYSIEDYNPVIKLYPQWADKGDVFKMNPGATYKGQLKNMANSRQFSVLHELMHFVGDSQLYPPVIPKTSPNGHFYGGSILDVRMASAAGRGEKKWLSKQTGLQGKAVEDALGYGELNTLVLPQLRYGPYYAIHNSDSYTMFAWALLLNWNANGVYAPEKGDAQLFYKDAVRRDPFAHLPPPFDKKGMTRYRAWWTKTGRTEFLAQSQD